MLTKSQCDLVVNAYLAKGHAEAGRIVMSMLREENGFRDLLVKVDSELSAIAHGRPPSDCGTLVDLYSRLRSSYNSI